MTDLLGRLRGLPPPVEGLDVFGAAQHRRDVEQITLMEGPEMDLHATIEGTSRRWRRSVRPRPPRTRCVVKGLISPREPDAAE